MASDESLMIRIVAAISCVLLILEGANALDALEPSDSTGPNVSRSFGFQKNDSELQVPPPVVSGQPWQLSADSLRMYTHSIDTWIDPSDETAGARGIVIDPAQFRLHIKVLTFNRVNSLHRCLQSLVSAHYDSEPVFLDIHVDHPYRRHRVWAPGDADSYNSEYASRIEAMHQLVASLRNFTWPHGPKRVSIRWENAGLQAQWIESWFPDSPNEFAFVVEDDMVVSPLYYRYLKRLLAHYYFNETNFNPRVYGTTLQMQHETIGRNARSLDVHVGVTFTWIDTHSLLHSPCVSGAGSH